MTDIIAPLPARVPAWRRLAWILLPLLALAGAIAWIVVTDPLQSFNNGAPPVEALTFERTVSTMQAFTCKCGPEARNR